MPLERAFEFFLQLRYTGLILFALNYFSKNMAMTNSYCADCRISYVVLPKTDQLSVYFSHNS